MSLNSKQSSGPNGRGWSNLKFRKQPLNGMLLGRRWYFLLRQHRFA